MAERTVKVSLTAQVAGYIDGMNRASKATSTFSDEAKKKLEAQGKAFTSVGTLAMGAGALITAGFALAVKSSADFEQAMSNVQAALQVSSGEMAKLRDAALEAGAKTVYSATQAAGAIEELGKNGLTTSQILNGGLAGALNLATSGQLDVARAAEVAAVSMKQFGLSGSDVPHIADLLAAGAGKAAGDVEDLAQALAQGGLVAHQSGLTIEETTGILSAFADQGLKGSDAGTSLKSMLQALTPTSKKAADEMANLGISAYDSSGHFVGAAALAGNLQDKLKDLSPEARNSAESIIFGSDAVRSASVLYDLGAKGIQKYIDQTNDSGYAAKVAAGRIDNLKGDLEQLSGSLQTALIKSGTASNEAFRGLTQALTGVVNSYGQLPDAAQSSIGIFTGIAGAVLLANGAFLTGVPKLVAYRAAVQELGTVGRVTGSVLKTAFGVTAAATAVLVGVQALNTYLTTLGATDAQLQNLIATKQSADDILRAGFQGKAEGFDFDNGAAAIANYADKIRSVKALQDNWFARFTSDADNGSQLQNVLGNLSDQLATMATDNLPAAEEAFTKLAAPLQGNRSLILAQLNAMPTFKDALRDQASAAGVVADDQTLLSIALGETAIGTKAASDAASSYTPALGDQADVSDQATKNLDALVEAMKNYNEKAYAAANSSIALEQSIDDTADRVHKITAGTKGFAATLDITTQAGRDNTKMLLELAQNTNAAAADTLAQTGNAKKSNDTLREGRKAFIDAAKAMGDTKEEAHALWKQYGAIPKDVSTNFDATGIPAAQRELQAFIDQIQGLPKRIGLSVSATGTLVYSDSRNGNGKAAGGAVYGPGTGTSDDVDAKLSNGEHVLTAAEVTKAGGQGAVYAARARLMGGGGLAFAQGGAVEFLGGTADGTTADMVSNVKAAREAEKRAKKAESDAQDHYSKVKSSDKAAKARAKTALEHAKAEADQATKDTAAAEKVLSDRRTADEALTKTYAGNISQQARDNTFTSSQIAGQPNTQAGQALAAKYREQLNGDLLSNAQANVKALQDVIADPQASAKAKTKAQTELKKQLADLNRLELAQQQEQLTTQQRVLDQNLAYLKSQSTSQSNSLLGQQLAQGYKEQLIGAQVSAAQKTVDDLQAIIVDASASPEARAAASAKLVGAIQSLNDLSLKQLEEQVAKTVSDAYKQIDLSGLDSAVGYKTVKNADGSTSVFGVTGAVTADSIDAAFGKSAADEAAFGAKLQQLSGKIPVALLMYIEGLGVTKGTPYADALLSATDPQLARISANYLASSNTADTIGNLIAAAQAGTNTGGSILMTLFNTLTGHADGGAIYGPGTSRSDSVLRRLSAGEHVITADEVNGAGGHAAIYAMRAGWRNGYAAPGATAPVQYAPPPNITTVHNFYNTQNYQGESSASQRLNDALAFKKMASL